MFAALTDDRLIETTTSLCPECMTRVEAWLVEKEGSVYLHKECPVHGAQDALLEKNAGYYRTRGAFDKPGDPSITQTRAERGCPFDCGLCPNHKQHTCIGLIEITRNCTLNCPDCYALTNRDGAEPDTPGTLSLEQVSSMMDFFQVTEGGKAEILQISGGEPTLHPQLLEILRLAKAKAFKCVMLNTNGLRLASDESFVRALAELAGGFEVYLQFDTFDPHACEQLRGKDLIQAKRKAAEQLDRYHVPTTLVATIKRGVNDHELGRLVQFGMDTGSVRGINFQPIAYFHGGHGGEAQSRTTLTEILERIESQTAGAIRLRDFVPLPCDVERVALAYLYRSAGRFTPISCGASLSKHLPAIPNTFAFDADDLLAATRAGGPASSCCDAAASFLRRLRPLIPANYFRSTPAAKVAHVSSHTFRISVSSFVDPYNFDLKSMQKECVHVITPDFRRIPFSAYNMFHRV